MLHHWHRNFALHFETGTPVLSVLSHCKNSHTSVLAPSARIFVSYTPHSAMCGPLKYLRVVVSLCCLYGEVMLISTCGGEMHFCGP